MSANELISIERFNSQLIEQTGMVQMIGGYLFELFVEQSTKIVETMLPLKI